ncbi:Pre-rRNA-processing protein IPI3 [Nosema granulosis]|uniref:Pre-rRNA-processing protein IPI3 n=1 Tax=Nosema granulosis TaxID=83296 RepID=A0A9P6GZU4_9MICR|nr:Pre-rRNA-processing protein IPI3 [Nosema granulosis]
MKSLSDNFKSTLLVHLKTKSNFQLDSTNILQTTNLSAWSRGRILVELEDGLKTYRIKPFSKISQVELKEKIEDILFVGDTFVFLSDSVLCISTEKETKRIPGDYKGVKLLEVGEFLGLKYPNKLELLKDGLVCYTFSGDLAFSSYNVLLVSSGFLLSIFVDFTKKLEVNLPLLPTSLSVDSFFCRIYCGTSSGDILCINLDGSPSSTLSYHKSRIVSLSHSFCNRFLYSADSTGVIGVWDCETGVIIDKVETGTEILCLKTSLTDSIEKIELPLILKSNIK